ncbi:hypothetical protein IR151_17580 [Clostridioides sp. ES-S-0006-03]|uniref:hypothetical protein n=1 Tax=Clostridioides sp. ES-S-0006-03 TaxID=2770775 RepID=UPI001D0C9DEF|nr:hypothetical protein [Clostridioides sp. ES-S-0006-03]
MKIEKIPCKIQTFSNDSEDGLIKAKVIIMHEGGNRKKVSFSKEVIDDAKESLKNRPLLAYIKRNADGEALDFESHKIIPKLIQTENGYQLEHFYLEQPIGLFSESCNPRYEIIDNVEHLVADCYIWEGYCNESYQLIMDDDGTKDVSMEIKTLEYELNSETGFTDIKKFQFRGVTILGDEVEQGMNGTCNLNIYSNNEEYDVFVQEMNNKIKNYERESGSVSEKNVIDTEPQVQTFGLSVENIRDQLYTQIESRTIEKTDYWGDKYQSREFWYRDLLPNENILIVESSNCYIYYGIPYSINGDTIIADFDNKKEYISEWREKTGELNVVHFDSNRDELKDRVLEKFQLKEEEVNTMKFELSKLEEFKKSIDNANYENDVESIVQEFSFNEDEICELKEKVLNREITKENFQKELYALEGMKIVNSRKGNMNFSSTDDNSIDLTSIKSKKQPKRKPYGGILG